MDLNKPAEFTSSCIQSPELPEFLPMPPPIEFLEKNLKNKEPMLFDHAKDNEEAKDSPFVQTMKQNLQEFWSQQMTDIENIQVFKHKHRLPLARIKKIMKTDKEVKMISADTPVLFSKAIELFVLELTLRSWMQTDECKRRTIQRADISKAIRQDELLQFLAGAIPAEQKAVLDEENTILDKEEAFNQFEEPVPNENVPLLNITPAYRPSPVPVDTPVYPVPVDAPVYPVPVDASVYLPMPFNGDVSVYSPMPFNGDAPVYGPMPFDADAPVYRPIPFEADAPFNRVKADGNVKFPEEIQVNNPNKLPYPLFDMNQDLFLQNEEIDREPETKPFMFSSDFGFLYNPAPKAMRIDDEFESSFEFETQNRDLNINSVLQQIQPSRANNG